VRARLPLTVAVLLVTASVRAESQGATMFARNAMPVSGEMKSDSPDGRSSVKAHSVPSITNDELHVVLESAGAIGVKTLAIGPGIGAELLWAPNSQAFAVTTNDGGSAGHFRTLVLGRWHGIVVTHDLTALISHAFGHPARCSWPESANVAAVTWLAGSQRLLLVAQIIPHVNCDGYGTFAAYEVDPWTLRIVHRYDQLQAKQLFAAQLGPALLAANDNCLRQPPSCYVPANHPELAAH
jgi:hypothetical protein